MWNSAGSIKASKVQQDEPTRAMSVEKFGINKTTIPVNSTSDVLRTH